MKAIHQFVWSYLRGNTSVEEWERFLYSSEEFERLVGAKKYLTLISADYRDKYDLFDVHQLLRGWLDETCERTCDCITWSSAAVVPICFETRPDLFFLTFEIIRKRNPWLQLVSCKQCGEAWYVATDTIDDDYHLLRLTPDQTNEIVEHDKWPKIFDDFKNVWPDPRYA